VEKVFFAIVRILFVLVALVSLFALVASIVYGIKLQYDSIEKSPDLLSTHATVPEVSFDAFESHAKNILDQEKTRKEHIKHYVINTIKQGSVGHGYAIGTMPSGLIPSDKASEVAIYIANGLAGQRPEAFKACVACHGEQGYAKDERAPNLHVLPIYNGIRQRVHQGTATRKDYQNYPKQTRSEYEKYIDRVLLLINQYASKTFQSGVQRDDVESYCSTQEKQYDTNTRKAFRKQLVQGLEGLNRFVETYLALKKSTPLTLKPIPWQSYLEWFSRDFKARVRANQEEQKRIDAENEQRIELAREKAIQADLMLERTLTFAGGALVVFILSTMLLVLIRIEYNTRQYDTTKD
jgi:cytochrome c553